MTLLSCSKTSRFYKTNARQRTSEQEKEEIRNNRFKLEVRSGEWAIEKDDTRFVKIGNNFYRKGTSPNETTPHKNRRR